MANRRYPRMIERPEEFLVNPEWPLWDRLLAYYAPQLSGQRLSGPREYSLLATHSTVLTPHYSDQLRRLVMPIAIGTQLGGFISASEFTASVVRPVTIGATIVTGSGYAGANGRPIFAWIDLAVGPDGQMIYMTDNGLSVQNVFLAAIRANNRATDLAVFFPNTSLAFSTAYTGVAVFDGSTSVSGYTCYLNGSPVTFSTFFNSYGGNATLTRKYGVCTRNQATTGEGTNALVSDAWIIDGVVSREIVEQLSDPTNVDLRIGNVPLILSPRRRFWPVVTQSAPSPSKVPWHLLVQSV
jgi:hypothetical protein